MSIDYEALAAPFPASDVEFRIGRAGKKNGQIWAKCLAYITSRAIMDRLDEVVGPENWQTEFHEGTGHMMAGIGIRAQDPETGMTEWVWKWDGTGLLSETGGLSGTDAGKGDFSNALKRVAVQLGIGRYLYQLPEGWANVHQNGANYARLPQDKGGDSFNWDPPELPAWALPGGSGKPDGTSVNRATGEVTEQPEQADNALRTELSVLVEELEKVGLAGDDAETLGRARKRAQEGGPREAVEAAIAWATETLHELQEA